MYRVIYKCRLCGEEYMAGATGDGNIAADCINKIVKRGYFCAFGENKGLCKENFHCCEDGSFGISDFQGFKKVEVLNHE